MVTCEIIVYFSSIKGQQVYGLEADCWDSFMADKFMAHLHKCAVMVTL